MENPHLPTKKELVASFGWEEYLILSLMLLVSTLIGVYFAWKGQKSNAEYLLGGKRMGVLPMSMSLIATMMSAIGMLGTPAEIYRYGSQFGAILLSFPLVMYSVTYWYLPVFWKIGVSTSYEYLEWRFNRSVRLLCSFLFSVQMALYMAIVVYAPALAIAQVTGFGVDLACGVIMGVCIFYTTIGGIKAVMWTDTFQSTIMFGSFVAILVKGTIDAGGVKNVFAANYNSSRIEFFNVDPDITTPYTMWSVVIGGWFYWLSIYGTNQAMVQRYLSAEHQSSTICAIWWNCLGITTLHVLYIFTAWIAWAFYNSVIGCDPIQTQLVDKQDQIIPLFVAHIMGDIPCVTGIFMAGVLSGALSTVSSGLSSLAAIAYQDFIQAGCQLKIAEKRGTIVTKALSAGFGILCYALVYVIKYVPGVVKASLSVFGITGGPLLGVFSLGMFFPWANTLGTFIGAVCSVVIMAWIATGKIISQGYGQFSTDQFLKDSVINDCPEYFLKNVTASSGTESYGRFTHIPIYELATMWYTPLSCSLCFLIGALVSILTKPQDIKKLNPDLISPAFYRTFRWFPWLAFLLAQQKHFESSIGSKYISGEKEIKLRKQAIMNIHDTIEETNNSALDLKPLNA